VGARTPATVHVSCRRVYRIGAGRIKDSPVRVTSAATSSRNYFERPASRRVYVWQSRDLSTALHHADACCKKNGLSAQRGFSHQWVVRHMECLITHRCKDDGLFVGEESCVTCALGAPRGHGRHALHFHGTLRGAQRDARCARGTTHGSPCESPNYDRRARKNVRARGTKVPRR
jgi:hypothetical protein